jgi:hypothetical protein
VIVAADSRVNFGDGKFGDSACKITALSDELIFAATGIVADDSYLIPKDLRFAAIAEARNAFMAVKSEHDNSETTDRSVVEKVADRWGRLMTMRFQDASPVRLQEWLKNVSTQHEPAFVMGIFAGLDSNGEIAVSTEHIDYIKPRKGSAVSVVVAPMTVSPEPTEVATTEGYGMTEIVREVLGGTSDFAQHAATELENLHKNSPSEDYDRLMAIRLVELTIEYHPRHQFVGGKVDAVELRRGGKISWIQRKDNCPAN